MAQVVLTMEEYIEMKEKIKLLNNIIDTCSKDGVFYARELEQFTTRISRLMIWDVTNFDGFYHNCTINYENKI